MPDNEGSVLNMPASKSDFEEITLAIGLLGGVIAILLYIGNFFNNNVIPTDADFQQIALSLVSILLIEIPMILLFFLLKCIPDCWNDKMKTVTQLLFKLCFIYFLIWLIALTITFTFGFIQIIFNIKILDYPGILLIYISLLTIILIIVGLFLLDCNIFKSISHVSRGDFWKRKKNPILLFLGFIVIVFTIPLLYYIINMSSLYLLMGSYSIEEFLQPNNENITVGIKETGLISKANFIHLYKIDSDFQDTDDIRIAYNQVNYSTNHLMVGTNNQQLGMWYLNTDTSKLQPGNYLVHAEVTIIQNPTLGTVKKQADKLFYISDKL